MKAQKIMLVKENIVLGGDNIARRIGYHPNDIARLVEGGRLTAWQVTPGGTWKTTPEFIDDFNKGEAIRFSQK